MVGMERLSANMKNIWIGTVKRKKISNMEQIPLEQDEQIIFVEWCRLNSKRGKQWKTPNILGMGKYLVNEYGDLVSFRKNEPHIMKKQLYKKTGYQYYPIQMGKKNKKIRVHSIVAKTFLPNDPDRCMVNHKDGDKTNNHVNNLEWCTNSENQIHAFRVLKSRHGGKAKKKVLCVETGERFESVSDAAASKNTFRSSIRKVINGKQSHAGGYTWQNA